MLDAIYNPVESYIDCFASLLLHGIIINTRRTLVVGDDGILRLWVAHTNECGSDSGGLQAQRKIAPSFASLVKAIIFLSTVLITWITPFAEGIGVSRNGGEFRLG